MHLTIGLSEPTDAAAPETIGVVLETSTGPVVECCQASGYPVYAINPKQADRLRNQFSPAGAKNDQHNTLVFGTGLFIEPQILRLLKNCRGE